MKMHVSVCMKMHMSVTVTCHMSEANHAGNEPCADKAPTPKPPKNAPINAMTSRTMLGTVLNFITAATIKATAHTMNETTYNHFAPVLFMSFHCKKQKTKDCLQAHLGVFRG